MLHVSSIAFIDKKVVLDKIPVLVWLCDQKYLNHFILEYNTWEIFVYKEYHYNYKKIRHKYL
jgi:hypothetical protein